LHHQQYGKENSEMQLHPATIAPMCWTVHSCHTYHSHQTVVAAAQPRQVVGSSHRHCESAMCHTHPEHLSPVWTWCKSVQ